MTMDLNDSYTQLWGIWVLLFAVIEGTAVFRKDKGATLSRHIWKFLGLKSKGYELPSGYKWRRGGLAVFFAWLIAHLGWGVLG